MWSLLPVLVSEFRWCFTLCFFIILLVRFWLLSSLLLGNSFPLGWPFVLIVLCLFVIFIYFPFGFRSGIWLLIAPVPVHCFSNIFVLSTPTPTICNGICKWIGFRQWCDRYPAIYWYICILCKHRPYFELDNTMVVVYTTTSKLPLIIIRRVINISKIT